MKVSGKGIMVILVFLLLIPFLIDSFFATAFSKEGIFDYSITKSFVTQYIKLIPSYISYLLVALAILYLIKKSWKGESKKGITAPDDETDIETKKE